MEQVECIIRSASSRRCNAATSRSSAFAAENERGGGGRDEHTGCPASHAADLRSGGRVSSSCAAVTDAERAGREAGLARASRYSKVGQVEYIGCSPNRPADLRSGNFAHSCCTAVTEAERAGGEAGLARASRHSKVG